MSRSSRMTTGDSKPSVERSDAGPRTALGAPWFVQFWPVFIAVLMALSIAASLATVVIAYRHADVDVRVGERLGQVERIGTQAETPR